MSASEPRRLSEAHKKKLAAGRAKVAETKAKENARKTKAWRAWCKEEAHAYAALTRARNGFDGEGNLAKIHGVWKHVLASQPPLPDSWVE